jgi:hypothetical protein
MKCFEERFLLGVARFFSELLQPWSTRTDQQQDGEQVDGHCRYLIQTS